MITIKSPHEIEIMREAGRITGAALAAAGAAVQVGVTTAEINAIAHSVITGAGATPSFLGYNGFPATICISINEELIHGIPGPRKLAEGDIVSVDVGAFYKGFHGDSAATFAVGKIDTATARLVQVTRQCFYDAVAEIKPGARLSDVSRAIQLCAEQNGFSVVRQFTGHGIGRDLHESPEVPCFALPGRGPKLTPGMTIAIEPMVNMGGFEVEYLRDRTTVVTKDRSLCAHYEHTVLVTDEGYELLTAREGDIP